MEGLDFGAKIPLECITQLTSRLEFIQVSTIGISQGFHLPDVQFENKMKQNVFLTSLYVWDPEAEQIPEGVNYYLSLNAGGRQILADAHFQATLLPLVLERANNDDDVGLDVVYDLLRGGVSVGLLRGSFS